MKHTINRRALIKLGLAGAGLAASASPAQALLRIVVSSGDFTPLPIAVPAFSGPETQLGIDAANVVTANLRRSGLFVPLDAAGFPVRAGDISTTPDFGAWRNLGADAVLMGQVQRSGTQIQANVRLWDVVAGEQMFGSTYATEQSSWRRIAHKVSDAVYTELTGEGAYFDSRLVYVAESGPKANRRKRLAMIDADGANLNYLTDGAELVLTPRFSPDNRMLTYVAYVNGNPQVFLLDVATGQQRGIGNFGQMTFSPRFSPDGVQLAFSVTNSGNTNLV
ncbi:MAG TPA: Tol-Pal system protein TolB, partial [Devosiaceae bacterium]|nr:Tol-Pal system protein TolB [Devosiaceae bacterium]